VAALKTRTDRLGLVALRQARLGGLGPTDQCTASPQQLIKWVHALTQWQQILARPHSGPLVPASARKLVEALVTGQDNRPRGKDRLQWAAHRGLVVDMVDQTHRSRTAWKGPWKSANQMPGASICS
jgi:hypothetical protein